MTRIVSGFQTQGGDWDGGALLRGYKEGAAARKSQEDAAQQGQMEQMRMMLAIKGALMEQERFELSKEKEQREAEQMRRADVEVGKAGKLQQMAQRAQAGQVNPGQKFVERVIGARGRLTNKDALKLFDDSVESLLNSQKAAKKRKAFDDSFARAQKDTKVFKPEQLQSIQERRSAGEDDETLAQELSKMRMEASTANVSRAENEKVLAEALATVQAQPDGYGKRAAMIALDAVMSSDSAMSEEGSGAKAAQAAAEALLGPRDEYGKGKEDPYADRLLFAEAYSQLEKEGGLPVDGGPDEMKAAVQKRMRMMNSDLPAPQPESVTRASPVKVDAVIRSALKGGHVKSGADGKGIAEALKAAGIPLTADALQMARTALQEYTNTARAAGGAERGR